MRLNDPSFPVSSTNPALSDSALGVVGGLVKLMTFQQIKDAVDSVGVDTVVTVEDVLTSTNTANALSAAQGKILNDALVLKAPLASPIFTGTPTAPTVAAATDNNEIATTAFVHDITDAIVTSIGDKAPIANPAFSGTPTAPTADTGTSTTQIASTAFVQQEISQITFTTIGAEESGAAATALTDANNYTDNLVADLCPLVEGKVPSANLPSYVDDALEFANLAAFPVTGESGIIYIAINDNTIYRWTGSIYVLIGDGTSVDVATVGSNHFPRYDQAQTLTDPQKAQTLTNIGAKKSYNLINKTASYTLALTDFQNDVDLYDKVYLRMDVAIANDVTIGTALSTLPNLSEISVRNVGAGFTTLVASGTTLNGILVFNTANEVKTLIKVDTNEWDVIGALT